jgi:hypothetical protein
VTRNDLLFVHRVIEMLADAGVHVWAFGGWAEELRGEPAAVHQDLDLLYPAADFTRLDDLLGAGDLDEIVTKHFPHKRAFVLDGIMVELFLVKRDEDGYHTEFWGRMRHDWPSDVLSVVGDLPVASSASLIGYRNNYARLTMQVVA